MDGIDRLQFHLKLNLASISIFHLLSATKGKFDTDKIESADQRNKKFASERGRFWDKEKIA